MNFIKYLGFFLLFSSCAFPGYKHITEVKEKLNLSQGKWILNNVEAPEGSIKDVTDMVLKKIKSDSVIYIDQLRLKFPLPYQIPSDPDSLMFNKLSFYTGCDYLISIKTSIIEDKPEGVYLQNPTGYMKQRSEASIIIYDLKYKKKIYSDQVVASIILGVDDANIRYAMSSKKLMFAALRKVLKSLKQNTR